MSIFDQMVIDDSNGENQYFYLNKKKFHYCVFPIILENKDKKQEHVLSIIYIFNKQLYYKHMLDYQKESYSKLIFQLFIFISFGVILLYLVVLCFNLMAKFIVIPIKNVQYMLEGINVGGEYRLDFLKNLQKKQEDNLEKLNKINLGLMQRNNSDKNKKKKNDTNLESSRNITKKLTRKQTDNKDSNIFEDGKKNTSIQENKTMKKRNSNLIKTIHDDEKLLNISTEIDDEVSNNKKDKNIELNGEIFDQNINYEKQYDLDNDILKKN
jgi:hypothetical protein